ncbi:hypothetical protein M0805_005440 [Coniferiporia weirii]|nr:hypothetical protein M0805_005440 [Coniferiporia weirii]
MPPGVRITRGSLATAGELASLSNRERLVFAQAVYEYGAKQSAWPEIAKLLSRHPLVPSRPKNFFTAQTCLAMYSYLMKEAELECTDLTEATKAPIHLQLAQYYYQERTKELRDEIAAEENRFKTLVTEIDDIRSGKWDNKILAGMNGMEVPVEVKSSTQQPGKYVLTAPAETEIPLNTKAPSRSHSPVDMLDASDKTPTAADIDDSDGEAPMDVSSPVRASSAEEAETSTEDPRWHNPEEGMEIEVSVEAEQAQQPPRPTREGSTDVDPQFRPTSPAPEAQSPKSPNFKERLRNKTEQRQASEGEEAEIEQEPSESAREDAQAMEDETVEVKDAAGHAAADEEASGQPPSGPQEPGSQESTPAPSGSRESKRGVSEVDGVASDSSRDKKRLREESEPVDDAESPATPSAMASGPKSTKERKRFQNVINMLHSQIQTHRNGTIFHNPIKPSEAPDYRDIVKRPMDLKTIKNRVRDGVIGTSSEYQRDIYLMFANSLMYNRPNSDIYVMAEEMMLDSEAHINSFRQTEVFNARTRI